VDALYFRVSSHRQTTENQIEDLVQVAERDDSGREWPLIREALAQVVIAEERSTAGGTVTLYRVVPHVAQALARQHVYVEQGRSGKAGAKNRPLFEQMKRDAAERKFDRVLVWKVSRLGRDMREVIATVYDLADHGVSVFPVKSQTGPINSTMRKLLWAIQAWFAEMENDERSEAIRAGQARARAAGALVGRPRVIFDRNAVVTLKDDAQRSWSEIAKELHVSSGSVRRAYRVLKSRPAPCQNYTSEGP
jgi:putative DNA-invertase from lambdoid prophage Rac